MQASRIGTLVVVLLVGIGTPVAAQGQAEPEFSPEELRVFPWPSDPPEQQGTQIPPKGRERRPGGSLGRP